MSSVHLRVEDPINEFSCGWHEWLVPGSLHLIRGPFPCHRALLGAFPSALGQYWGQRAETEDRALPAFLWDSMGHKGCPHIVQGEGLPCADPCTQGGCGSPRMSLSTQTHPRQHLHPSRLHNTRDQCCVHVTVGGTSWVALRHRGCVHLIPQCVCWWAGGSAWT